MAVLFLKEERICMSCGQALYLSGMQSEQEYISKMYDASESMISGPQINFGGQISMVDLLRTNVKAQGVR